MQGEGRAMGSVTLWLNDLLTPSHDKEVSQHCHRRQLVSAWLLCGQELILLLLCRPNWDYALSEPLYYLNPFLVAQYEIDEG